MKEWVNVSPRHGRFSVFLSMVGTPLVLFISSSNGLYLRNQSELDHEWAVLLPFVGLFFLALAAGLLLLALPKGRLRNCLLWGFYLASPFFMLLVFLQNSSLGWHFFPWFFSTKIGTGLLVGFFLASVFIASYKAPVARAVRPFAALSGLLLTAETFLFLGRVLPKPEAQALPEAAFRPTQRTRSLPSIYHIVFDGYPGEVFPLTLGPAGEDALKGFIYYPRNRSIYGATALALPSILTGRSQDSMIPAEEWRNRAFNSPDSLLYWLKEVGYTTLGYIPSMYAPRLDLLDWVVLHGGNGKQEEVRKLNHATFSRLWLYANCPRLLTNLMMDTNWFLEREGSTTIRLLKNGRFLPYSAPVISYNSYLETLDQVEHLPASNRYTLIHVAIPHSPYVLRSDCSYDENGADSDLLQQSRCATKMLLNLLSRLERKGDLDNSLIVAHGDHGDFYRVRGDRLEPAETISLQTLLLLKPPRSRGPFRVCQRESTVLDIAPTILAAVGARRSVEMEGSVLREALAAP